MSQRTFVGIAVLVGLAVPLAWLTFYWSFLRSNSALISEFMETGFDRVLVALWPSWLFLIADPEERNLTITAVSVFINGVLYGILGWLLWLGIYSKGRVFLGLTLFTTSIAWYLLLRLYMGN